MNSDEARKIAGKKSGDAKLQDAEAAQESQRLKGEEMSPIERIQTLPDQLQGAAEERRSKGQNADITLAAFQALTEALKTVTSRLDRMEAQADQKKLMTPEALMRCSTCGQVVKSTKTGRGICNGEHVRIFVAPKTMEMWSAFQGVEINGSKYAGPALVPPDLVDTIFGIIGRWETKERQKYISGGRIFGEIGETANLAPGRSRII